MPRCGWPPKVTKRVIGPLTVIDRSRRCVRVIFVDPGAEAGRAKLRASLSSLTAC